MYAFSLILQKVYLVWKIAVKALVVFSPIFVADAKIILLWFRGSFKEGFFRNFE